TSRRGADDAGYGGRFRDSPAARLRHRRRPRRVADSDALYDASRLYLLRPAAELDDAGKKEAGALRPSRAAACGPRLTLSPCARLGRLHGGYGESRAFCSPLTR